MKKFVIENEFWELFPTAKIGIIVANDIDNTIKDEAKYAPMLAAAEKETERTSAKGKASNLPKAPLPAPRTAKKQRQAPPASSAASQPSQELAAES